MALFSDSSASTDDLKILAIGDVHLGTRPSGLPEELDEWGVDPRTLTPEAALEAAVDLAVREGVDLVLFAGDVVESTNARFEALRPLESAVCRLLDAGIAVLGVAGNHDVEALPRLAGMIEGFELLGQGGVWQTRLIEKGGKPAAEILGWSFPERQVRASPILDLIRNPIPSHHAGIPRIGLLHGDLDASGGTYAPFTSSQLDEAAADAWLLGHIHKPSLAGSGGLGGLGELGGAGPRGYLGSLVGLDPGELGQRGPWLLRVSRGGEITTNHLPIAPLRWEKVDCSIGEADDPEAVADQLIATAARVASELQASGPAPQVLGVRPCLTGPTRHYDALRRSVEEGRWKHINRQVGDTLVFIDKVFDGLELARDLAELARGDDPPAILARKLLALARPGDERRALLDAARRHLSDLANDARWSPLAEERDASDPLTDEALIERLNRSGTAALSELLAQSVTAQSVIEGSATE